MTFNFHKGNSDGPRSMHSRTHLWLAVGHLPPKVPSTLFYMHTLSLATSSLNTYSTGAKTGQGQSNCWTNCISAHTHTHNNKHTQM